MKKQVDVQSYATLKQIHVLMVSELSSQQGIHWNLGTGTWDLDASFAAFNEEDSDLIARDGKVDLVPFSVAVAFPRNEDTLFRKGSRGIFERSKFGFPTGSLELLFVIVLFRERHKESFLAVAELAWVKEKQET